MNTEDAYRAASRMQDAADRAQNAADRIESAAHRIALLLEDGYGGNGLRLLDAIERATDMLPKQISGTSRGADGIQNAKTP